MSKKKRNGSSATKYIVSWFSLSNVLCTVLDFKLNHVNFEKKLLTKSVANFNQKFCSFWAKKLHLYVDLKNQNIQVMAKKIIYRSRY